MAATKATAERYNLRKRKLPPEDIYEDNLSNQDIEEILDSDDDSDYDYDQEVSEVRAARSVSQSSLGPERYQLEDGETTQTLADIGGLEKLKKKIMGAVVVPFFCPDKAEAMGSRPPRGVLLTGKPGTGKTMLAEAIVSEIRTLGRQVKFYTETGGCINMYIGETEKRIRDIFKMAHDNQPSIVFFDELDGLGRARDGCAKEMATVVTTFLNEMNKVKRGQVMVIAATNYKALVDSALIRKGRFDEFFHLPLPDLASRKEILQLYQAKCGQIMDKKSFNQLAARTDKYTGSDLELLVQAINTNVNERVFPNQSFLKMTVEEIRKVRQTSKAMKVIMAKDVDPILPTFLKGEADEDEE